MVKHLPEKYPQNTPFPVLPPFTSFLSVTYEKTGVLSVSASYPRFVVVIRLGFAVYCGVSLFMVVLRVVSCVEVKQLGLFIVNITVREVDSIVLADVDVTWAG